METVKRKALKLEILPALVEGGVWEGLEPSNERHQRVFERQHERQSIRGVWEGLEHRLKRFLTITTEIAAYVDPAQPTQQGLSINYWLLDWGSQFVT